MARPDSFEPGQLVPERLDRAVDPRDPPLDERGALGGQDRLTRAGDVGLLQSQRRIPPGQCAAIAQQGPQVRRLGQREHAVEEAPSFESGASRQLHVAGKEHHREPPADRRRESPLLHLVDRDPLLPARGQECRGERSRRLAVEHRLDVESRAVEGDQFRIGCAAK